MNNHREKGPAKSAAMFKIVDSLDELIKVFIVRGIVFIDEQKVPYRIEMDKHELSALHILGELDGEPNARSGISVRFLRPARFSGSGRAVQRGGY